MMVAYQKGTLISWNDDRGFGFIDPGNGTKTVFLHISALKKSGRRPQEGDTIYYQLMMDKQDRVQASHAYIEGIQYQRGGTSRSSGKSGRVHRYLAANYGGGKSKRVSNRGNKASNRKWRILLVSILVFILWKSVQYFSQSVPNTSVPLSSPSQLYRCEGKTRCSQMESCGEATFYLQNCPGVQIDGDMDGIPCEDQWCGNE